MASSSLACALPSASFLGRSVRRSAGKDAKPRRAGSSSRVGVRTMAVGQADKIGSTTLSTWLFKQEREGKIDNDLANILSSIAVANKKIANLVSTAPIRGLTGTIGSTNESGDEQKKLDVISNDIFCECVADTGRSAVVVTEEEDVPVAMECISGDYIVCFDPIDGSSNIDAAVTTGSIFGIYSPGECIIDADDDPEAVMEKCTLNTRKSGEELVAAGYCMFSSSTILMLTAGDGVFGFTLDTSIGEFVLSHPNQMMPDPGQRIYSGNQANVSLWAPEMKAYVDLLGQGGPDGGKPWSLRYIGALVGDFHRTLMYGGIWLYPPDSKAPEGKARLLYEVAPMGFLAEQAGGLAMWGEKADKRVLEVVPQSIHQRSPMFVGSATHVKGLQDFLAEQ